MFDWAHFCRTKGAIKLHLILDHDGYLPFAVITDANTAEVEIARQLHFDPDTIVVDDRGANSVFQVVQQRPVPQDRHIVSDQIIELSDVKAREKCPYYLRRIELYNADTGEVLVFLTNHMSWGASTVAAVYKDRWQIGLFFKGIKQNLKIKTFVGTSANAVKIQVWTALIAMVILRFLQLRSQFDWSLSNLVALLRMNLFTHRDLWAWLNKPFEITAVLYEPEQLRLIVG